MQELVLSGELRLRNEYSVTGNQVNNTRTQADANRFRLIATRTLGILRHVV